MGKLKNKPLANLLKSILIPSSNLIPSQILLLIFIPNMAHSVSPVLLAPIAIEDRDTWESLPLTSIGAFGYIRKARPHIPEHLHTGIDIMRPRNNYNYEPVFSVLSGVIISKREDGPFAQIIIEHNLTCNGNIWTVYEHLSGITVSVGDVVSPYQPIGRFMNVEELTQYGWQFNHVHFEILKHEPKPIVPSPKTPSRFFDTYSLVCYTEAELEKYYYNPLEFVDYSFTGY